MAAAEEPLNVSPKDTLKPRAFTAVELVPCPQCLRTNPPTRRSCLYCGDELEATELIEMELPHAAQTETAGDGLFHVIGVSRAEHSPDALSVSAVLPHLNGLQQETLLNHPIGAPLLAAKSQNEARMICDNLRAEGLETIIVADEELAPALPQYEIAALEFGEEAITGIMRRSGERVTARWSDVLLVITGRLYFATTEIEQKRNRSKDVITERELIADEAVVDLYSRPGNAAWRIRASAFDFSCLGDEKKLTVFQNLAALLHLINERAPHAVFDDSYVRLRASLNEVWPPELRRGREERHRIMFAEYDASATTSDNEEQFTRYSRLLHFLALRQPIDDAGKA